MSGAARKRKARLRLTAPTGGDEPFYRAHRMAEREPCAIEDDCAICELLCPGCAVQAHEFVQDARFDEKREARGTVLADVLDAIRTRAVAAERRGDEVTARVLYELCEEIAWRGVP